MTTETQQAAHMLHDYAELNTRVRPGKPFVGIQVGYCGACEHSPEAHQDRDGYESHCGADQWCGCAGYVPKSVPNTLCACGHWLDSHWIEGGIDSEMECIAEVGDGYCTCIAFEQRVEGRSYVEAAL